MTEVLDWLSEQAKRARWAADDEALRLGHWEVGPEHVLLGVLSVEDSIGSRVLRNHNVTLGKARNRAAGVFPQASAAELDRSLVRRTMKSALRQSFLQRQP